MPLDEKASYPTITKHCSQYRLQSPSWVCTFHLRLGLTLLFMLLPSETLANLHVMGN